MIKGKTVYVLGAGFSYLLAPCQNKILTEILDLKCSNSWHTYKNDFEQSRENLTESLKEFFACDDEGLKKINLEDILTILDRAILTNEYLRNKNTQDLIELKNDLLFCIGYMFDEKLTNVDTKFYINLAAKIVEKRIRDDQQDLTAFISLNWDLLLDNSIYNQTRNSDKVITSLDYCTYTNNFDKSIDDIPDSNKKAAGIKNIKLIKLHGSFNWLLCKNCNRLLKTMNRKFIVEAYKEINCPYCEKPSLAGLIISPTLLKDLNNVHLKTIWHNAEIELMEASRIVFVGYSFPLADFEFRYLLKRCIDKSAKIDIVLYGDKVAKHRYKNFFGNQIIRNDNYILPASEYFNKKFGITNSGH